ncbi:hypothetical protein CMI47_22015 [Candidatus Pacearchaeota archaeon]|nr:hypothetical protein [Candidatus Pacearchaeota archaeon]|tara:strand:- start:973 stop:1353 length:381 start_codon:yes stop_codon:yes gene_type:complete
MKVEVSNGEVVDKITILKIKLEKIDDPVKIKNIKKEHDILEPLVESFSPAFSIREDIQDLYETNLQLWDIEDSIREKERIQEFDDEFISLARSVYRMNDKRAKIKKDINEKTFSHLIEEKSYQKWN